VPGFFLSHRRLLSTSLLDAPSSDAAARGAPVVTTVVNPPQDPIQEDDFVIVEDIQDSVFENQRCGLFGKFSVKWLAIDPRGPWSTAGGEPRTPPAKDPIPKVPRSVPPVRLSS
jgi:hypothetical protein